MMDQTGAATARDLLANDAEALHCPGCDYDLRALAGDRCPECGLVIDRASLAAAQIPWSFRKGMGRWRAYRKTMSLAILRPRVLASSVALPVSYADARSFQRTTIVLASIPLVALGLWGYFASLAPGTLAGGRPQGSLLAWALEVIGLCFCAGCIALFFFAASGVGSYFFHPNHLSISRQNRAIALSYYGCAPLAWTWIPAILVAAMIFFGQSRWSEMRGATRVFDLLLCLTLGAVVLEGAAWLRCNMMLMKRTTGCGATRTIALGLFLAFAWYCLGFVILFLLPIVYVCLALMILSLR